MVYIYKLKISGKSYVGSTNNIHNRIIQHKSDCSNKKRIQHNYKLYKFIRENGGWKNVEVHILQECNKDVKQIIEDFYIKHYKCELNDKGAKIDLEKSKENKRRYYEKTKQQVLEKRKTEKYACECGSTIRKYELDKHKKTNKHQNYLASLASSSSSLASFHSKGLK